jgi:hypothetical protein
MRRGCVRCKCPKPFGIQIVGSFLDGEGAESRRFQNMEIDCMLGLWRVPEGDRVDGKPMFASAEAHTWRATRHSAC